MRRFPALTSLAVAGALALSFIAAPGASAGKASAKGWKKYQAKAKNSVVQRDLFGMHVFNVEDGVWPTVPIGSLRLWDNETTWSVLEPAPNQYNWGKLDTAVANAEQNGVNDILFVLAGTPSWATDDPASGGAAGVLPGAAGVPRNLADWDDFVREVATRYKGRISAYQVWNEANLVTFSTATAQEMAALTKNAYDIIKSIDPKATVVAPSMGTRLGSKGSTLSKKLDRYLDAYLRDMKNYGWPVDVWAAHTYPASLGTPADRGLLIKGYMNLLKKYQAPTKPIWDTENNFGLAGPGPQNPDQDITDNRASSWTAQTYLDALRYGISRVYWYAWGPENDLVGIQMYEGTPAATAYTTLQDWIVGSTFKGCKGGNKGKPVDCTFVKDGKNTKVIWTEKGSKKFKTKGFSEVCSLNGTCTPISGKSVRVSDPVLLTN